MSSLVHPDLHFSALSLYEDYLFLGTLEGTYFSFAAPLNLTDILGEIEIYQLSSMKFMKSMKSLKENVQQSRSILTSEQGSQSKGFGQFGDVFRSNQKDLSIKKSEHIKKIVVASE